MKAPIIKPLFIITFILFFYSNAIAQRNTDSLGTIKLDTITFSQKASSHQKIFDGKNIPSFDIALNATTTLVSPDPITLVDISSDKVQGELSPATDNRIFRIKPTPAFLENDSVLITVITKKYIAVLKLIASNTIPNQAVYAIAINPNETYRLDAFNNLSIGDFQKLALYAMTKKRSIHSIKSKSNGLQAWVGNSFIAGEYILLDLSLKNKTNLPYDIESIRFRIIDKYNVSAHVSQEIEMVPDYSLYGKENWQFNRQWRDIFVFPKFTYPGNKIFQIEIEERQISGRKILINIDYAQILHSNILQ